MPEFTTKQREKLAEEKEAMPDGSYPIRNRDDLKNAIQAFGRSKNPEKTKAWIKKRARELDAEDLIPESWKEVEHMDNTSDYLVHYGVLGMKWGVRKDRRKAVTSLKKKNTEERKKTASRNRAKIDIAKYGSKSNAVKALSKKADKKANAKTLAKKGAGYTASILSTHGALSLANAQGFASAASLANSLAGKTLLAGGAAMGMPVAAILGAAGLGVGAAVVTSKMKKSKRSKKDQSRIDAVKKSR